MLPFTAPQPKPLTHVAVAVRLPRGGTDEWAERCVTALRAVPSANVTCVGARTRGLEGTDLVLDLSDGAFGECDAEPRLGYWTFLYGETAERGNVALREHVAGRRAVMVRLVRLTGPRDASVLMEGAFKAVAHSRAATRRRVQNAVAGWPARCLRERLAEAAAPAAGSVTVGRTPPVAAATLRALLPLASLRNLARRLTLELTAEQWAIGVIAKPVEHVLESFDADAIRWLPVPEGGFLADPFGTVAPDGTVTVLAEALSFRENVGRIVTFEIAPDGAVTVPRDVMHATVHASYPQIVEHGGRIYCLPETGRLGRVQLHRATAFPDRWVPDCVLLEDFAGADATVFTHDGRWWMLAANQRDQGETKLFAFHAPDLFGPWTAHAENPVKCDLRSSRPAGTPFASGGALYRPAQDCSATYGGAIVVNRITTLTPAAFREAPVARLAPAPDGPYPHGLHTLVGVGNITLVDGKRHVRSARGLVAGFKRIARDTRRP